MIKEFRDFVMRGNVLELAVAVILGGAFGKVVSSFVKDIIMPPVGLALGGVDFSNLKMVLQEELKNDGGEIVRELVAINWGAFVQFTIDFIIVALVLFLVIKGYNSMQKKKEEAPAPPPGPTNEEKLLEEIRDLLKNQND